MCSIAADAACAARSTCAISARTIELEAQMTLHRRPLAFQNTEHDRVAINPVGRDLVIAEDTVLLGAKSRNGGTRPLIEPAGAELDGDAPQRLERVAQEQDLGLGVHGRSLKALRIPRIADFHPSMLGLDVEVTRASNDCTARVLANDERHRALGLAH